MWLGIDAGVGVYRAVLGVSWFDPGNDTGLDLTLSVFWRFVGEGALVNSVYGEAPPRRGNETLFAGARDTIGDATGGHLHHGVV